MMALLGGKIDVFVGNGGDVRSQYKEGAVRILGIMDSEESPFYPGVKTFEAQGYKLYSLATRGYAAPRGTPKEIVGILSEAIRKAITTEENKKKMADYGVIVRYMGPEQYGKYFDEREKTMRELMPLARSRLRIALDVHLAFYLIRFDQEPDRGYILFGNSEELLFKLLHQSGIRIIGRFRIQSNNKPEQRHICPHFLTQLHA